MTGIVILAGGASSRMGRAKQTLMYKGKSLLKHTIDTAIEIALRNVVVVVGANEPEISAEIANEPVTWGKNKDWQNGMASSITTGLTTLLNNNKEINQVILMVCDQPFVDVALLSNILNTKNQTGKSIVACSYKDTLGVPALFDKIHFDSLLALKGEEGGKKILFNNQEAIASVPFPGGAVDIDTVADYEALCKQ